MGGGSDARCTWSSLLNLVNVSHSLIHFHVRGLYNAAVNLSLTFTVENLSLKHTADEYFHFFLCWWQPHTLALHLGWLRESFQFRIILTKQNKQPRRNICFPIPYDHELKWNSLTNHVCQPTMSSKMFSFCIWLWLQGLQLVPGCCRFPCPHDTKHGNFLIYRFCIEILINWFLINWKSV